MDWGDMKSDSMLSFSDLHEQLDSIDGDEEVVKDDKYWNTSQQTGFNFDEDGPVMVAPQANSSVARPKMLEFTPKLELRTRELQTPTGRSTPKETAENIFLGNPYNLEQFRSKESKLQLLDAASGIGDTSTLQIVILFLRSSLKSSLLQRALMERPLALRAYLNYLRENGEGSQFYEQLNLSGLADEVCEHKYRRINHLDDCKAQQNSLDASLNIFMGSPDSGLIRDQLSLLQLQSKIHEIDKLTLDVCENIVGFSLTETVRYCAKYHSKDPETHFSSPAFLKANLNLSNEQYSHACISGYAESQNYPAIESFLESKSWLGKKKLSSAIGFEKIVEILHRHQAPKDVLEKYIAYVDDVEERLELAERVGALNSLVNCYVQMKDRIGLEKILSKLPRESTATQLAQSSLGNSAIKWKN